MSLKTEGLSCARCHAYLFSEDDVVHCPVCGAPHHRECYNQIGHCALEEFHGTEQQYDKVKERAETEANNKAEEEHAAEGFITCGMCHEKYSFNEPVCPNCKAPNIARNGGSFISFDFLGGIPADFDMGEGVTADEAKRFVMANTPRYIPKFASIKAGSRISWNWMAFLFPSAWMLARKMYKNGIITGILSIVATLFSIPLVTSLNSLLPTDVNNYVGLLGSIYEVMPKIGAGVMIAAFISVILNLSIRFVSGILGDYFYKNHTVSTVKKIKLESSDIVTDYRKKGGVNIFLFLIGTLALQYIPNIIAMFIV